MAGVDQKIRRLTLLERKQAAEVRHAASRYQQQLAAIQEARDKLAGLESYFADESADSPTLTHIGALREASVFRNRLASALDAQRAVCDRIDSQVEHARHFLTLAEQKRAGFERIIADSKRQRAQALAKAEQKATEDVVLARYIRTSG